MSRVDGDYKYAEVEAEMLAIFPDIHVGEGRTAQYDSRQPRRPTPRANVTDADRSSDAGSHEQPGEESDDGSSPADPDTGEVEEALEKELSALAAIVEDNQELGEEIDTIQEAAEQVQDALITMRESKKKIQAARKDRSYTPKKNSKPRSPSPHPSRSSGSSTDRIKDKIKERKKNSTCK